MRTDRLPVIVGVGEYTLKTKDPARGLEPIALMERALTAAQSDVGVAMLHAIDSLDVVCEVSWPYEDAPVQLSSRMGISPARLAYSKVGGEEPVRLIHEAAMRVARGESELAAIVGAEASYSVAAAEKAGDVLAWTPRFEGLQVERGAQICNPIAVRHGVFTPATIYPFYENAFSAAIGQTPVQALEETGEIWSRMSMVAEGSRHSWLTTPRTPQEIVTPGANNRHIAWPYTKYMVANPLVNQGAAVLVTSFARAKEMGIAPSRMVHIWGGFHAREPRDYLMRDQFHRSHAQDTVLEHAREFASGTPDLLELYSCFPVVPKMARRLLGVAQESPMTVAGGLSFFGAPLNNYMSHAAAAMVGALRAGAGRTGLLYGQGEYVTKHHALVLGREARPQGFMQDETSVQGIADSRRGPVPELVLAYTGAALLETFTVLFDRTGTRDYGVVIARTPSGQRLLAGVPREDDATLDRLMSLHATPVGSPGTVADRGNGLLAWSVSV